MERTVLAFAARGGTLQHVRSALGAATKQQSIIRPLSTLQRRPAPFGTPSRFFWSPSHMAAATGKGGPTTAATAQLAASMVQSVPSMVQPSSPAEAAASAKDDLIPWHHFNVSHVLRYKAGRARPQADREMSQRAGIFEMRETDSVAQAAEFMLSSGAGSVLVNSGPVLAGIVTLDDILRRVFANRRDPVSTNLRDIMSSQVTCATEAYTLEQCMATLENGRFRHVPIYRDLSTGGGQSFDEDPRLVGVVSLTDVTLFMAQYLQDHPDMGQRTVADILPTSPLNQELFQVADDATCDEAMKKLLAGKRGVVIVARGASKEGAGGKPIGMLTERNVLRHVLSSGQYYADTLVKAMPVDQLPIVEAHMPLAHLVALQAAQSLNQVPVVDKVRRPTFKFQ